VRANHVGLAQGADTRSHARKMLASIEAALEAFAANLDHEVLRDRHAPVTCADVPELLVLRDRYRWEAASEDAAADIAGGKPNPRNVGIRFGRP
jgi:predicted metal-dependent hydrolase